MKIAVDARCLTVDRTGVGKYLEGLLEGIARIDSRHEFFLCSREPIAFEAPNEHWHARLVRRGLPYLQSLLWLEDCGRQIARRERLDLFWGACGLLPVKLPPGTATLVSALDLVLLNRRSDWNVTPSRGVGVLRSILFPLSVRRADEVLTISEVVARELEDELRVPRTRITVAPPGVASRFQLLDRGTVARDLRLSHGIEGDYVLTVLTRLDPRKNLVTLLHAYAALPRALRTRAPLMVLGAARGRPPELESLAAPLVAEGSVRFLGYVPDEHMPWLYAGASLFAFPTLYEGFGMPVVEAMACGAPALVSDIPVLHEVAGDAAAYVPPLDALAWARAIEAHLSDSPVRSRLAERGVARASACRFDRSAAVVLDRLERLAHEARARRRQSSPSRRR